MARETVALQKVIPDTTLIHILASELWLQVIGKREFETYLGIRNIDNVGTIILYPTDVKFSFLVEGSDGPHAVLNISARVLCHRDKLAGIFVLDCVKISGSILDRRDVSAGVGEGT